MTRRKTTSEFRVEVAERTNEAYEVLGDYVNNRTKILLMHKECENTFEMRPDEFLRGKRCPPCYRNTPITTAEFIDYVKTTVGSEYSVLGEYKNNRTPILFKHNLCGREFTSRPDNFKSGKRCPGCIRSQGEDMVLEFLIDRKIPYVREFSFTECRNIHSLRFDFGVLDQEKCVIAVIEYDGEQHFKVVKHFGGVKGFENRIKNDAIKNKYCADNGIPLIRIPYWEYDNIDAILTQKLLPLLEERKYSTAS